MRSITHALTKLRHFLRPQHGPDYDQRQLDLFPAPVEPIAPITSLKDEWLFVRKTYFPDRPDLDDYRVVWSTRRHTSTLASCNVERRRILVAAAFQLEEAKPHLEALLYHEMCHAVLGRPKRVGRRRVIHGRDFRELERRHPGIPELDRWIKLGSWHTATRKSRRIELNRRRRELAKRSGS